jgi:hypothetical protein
VLLLGTFVCKCVAHHHAHLVLAEKNGKPNKIKEQEEEDEKESG